MEVKEFYKELREHCNSRCKNHDPHGSKTCYTCCFRILCWVPVCDINEALIDRVISSFGDTADRTDNIMEECADLLRSQGTHSLEYTGKVLGSLASRDIVQTPSRYK